MTASGWLKNTTPLCTLEKLNNKWDDDFQIDLQGNLVTINPEKEESKEEKDKKHIHIRKEYGYSSLSRSFALPGEVVKNKIEAVYRMACLN